MKEREERKNAGRKRQRRDSSPEVQEVGRKSGGGNSNTASASTKRFEQNGPCIWCSKHGHIYRFCDLWKADVDSGAAKYNTTTRKWERVNKDAAPAKQN